MRSRDGRQASGGGRAGALLEAVKARAKAKGIPYARYVRMLLEADVAQPR